MGHRFGQSSLDVVNTKQGYTIHAGKQFAIELHNLHSLACLCIEQCLTLRLDTLRTLLMPHL